MILWIYFSVQGSFEAFARQCGCCGGLMEDEERREHLEVACDFATHYLCHPCALCQEARELRRRVPHPGFNNGRSVFVMMPPMEQTMGRGMWASSCPCPALVGSVLPVMASPSCLFARKYKFVVCDHVVLRVWTAVWILNCIVSPVFVVRGPPSTWEIQNIRLKFILGMFLFLYGRPPSHDWMTSKIQLACDQHSVGILRLMWSES